MNRNINLNKVKEYSNNIIGLYEGVDAEAYNEWFDLEGYLEVTDSTEEVLAQGLVDYYVNDIM
jgi:hypothetical protein